MPFTALKAINKTDTELIVRNHIVLFNTRDAEILRKGFNADGSSGEFFEPTVDLNSPATQGGRLPVDFEHREGELGKAVLGYVDWSTAEKDDEGWIVDRILDRRQKYVKLLEPLIEQGLIGTSSEPYQSMVKVKNNGGIIQWGLMRDTLTVNPADPKMLKEFGDNAITALKNVSEFMPAAKSLLDAIEKQTGTHSDGDKDGTNKKVTVVQRRTVTVQTKPIVRKTMDILQAIKELMPDLKEDQVKKLAAIMGLTGYGVASTPDEELVDPEGKAIKSILIGDLVDQLKKMGCNVQIPGVPKQKAIQRPVYEANPAASREDAEAPGSEEDPEVTKRQKSIEAFHIARFNDESEAHKAIQQDVIGKNYQQTIYEQNVAYAKYLRGGDKLLDARDVRILKSLYLPLDQVMWMVKEGFDVAAVKAVQVEAIGSMGGYAIPPEHVSEISKRLPGLTAVRGGGARVYTLANSNSIEITQWKGNSNTHIGLLRGEWGGETNSPDDQNFKLDLLQVTAHVYNIPVWMSTSAVEDAANLVSILNEDMATTAAIDEDIEFLTGNGLKKPDGILPDGANRNSLTEVASQGASALTAAGIKALKRGVPTQYRQRGVWVANSDTYSDIEQLTYATSGEFAFPDLSDEEKLLNRKAYESEAMPDVASSAFPILFGDMSGYDIVERLGMTIERFHDSYTGSNKVKFELRRRVGGAIEKPWMFALQKVAAS